MSMAQLLLVHFCLPNLKLHLKLTTEINECQLFHIVKLENRQACSKYERRRNNVNINLFVVKGRAHGRLDDCAIVDNDCWATAAVESKVTHILSIIKISKFNFETPSF